MDEYTRLLLNIGSVVFGAIFIAIGILVSGRQRQAQGLNPDDSLDAIRQMSTHDAYQKMQIDLRTWGWTLVGLGVIHLGYLNLPHGLLLIAFGLLSFLVRETSTYILYAVILAWTAIGNLMAFSKAPGWAIFGLVQIILSVQGFKRFSMYKKVQTDYNASLASNELQDASPQSGRTGQVFPLGSIVLGSLGFLGAVCGYGLPLVMSPMLQPDIINIASFGIDIALIMGVLGFALGLAAILSDAPRQVLSIIGSVAGGLTMVTGIGLTLLVRFAG
jgi:hypothetical protein